MVVSRLANTLSGESQCITQRVMSSAPVKAIDQEGASPFRANVTRLKLKV